MRAKAVHRGTTIEEGTRAALLSLPFFLGLAAHAGSLPAQGPAAASHVVAAPEQAARDSDRIEILRQELKKSEEQLEALVRRRAERMAASDMQAANEAEQQHARTLGDIAGLKREIASASRLAGRLAVLEPVAARAPDRRPGAGKGTAPVPWWDVYGGGRRTGSPGSQPLAPMPEQGVHASPARPLE